MTYIKRLNQISNWLFLISNIAAILSSLLPHFVAGVTFSLKCPHIHIDFKMPFFLKFFPEAFETAAVLEGLAVEWVCAFLLPLCSAMLTLCSLALTLPEIQFLDSVGRHSIWIVCRFHCFCTSGNSWNLHSLEGAFKWSWELWISRGWTLLQQRFNGKWAGTLPLVRWVLNPPF